jgi:hypothetical protein
LDGPSIAEKAFVVPTLGYLVLLFFLTLSGVGFIECIVEVTWINKESLANVLDLAADAGCSHVVACVKKNDTTSAVVRSLLATHFVLDNSLTLPNYVLLSFEL